MKSFLLIINILLSTLLFGQLNQRSITINQENRAYYEYLPLNYDNTEAAPLVIVLHGIGGFAQDYATYGLNNIADTARFVTVYLQGAVNSFNQTSWNNGTLLSSTADDLSFISSIIDTMHFDHNINRRKVYVVGISMGAIMTFKAVRHLSDKIAATVCHIGTMSNEEIANTSQAYPVPTMQVHGTQDAIVPYASTPLPSLSLVAPTLNKLKSVNGWNGTDSTIINIPDNQPDGVTIERIIYDCTTPLEHWKMNGADHIFLFENTNDTSGIVVTWQFLSRFTHPNISLNTTNYTATLTPQIYPNPNQGHLTIEGVDDQATIMIYNLNHQLMLSQKLGYNGVDLSTLAQGLYVLKIIDSEGQHYQQIITKQ